MRLMLKGCLLVVAVMAVCARAAEIDSINLQISKRPLGEVGSWHEDSVRRYNPAIPGLASLVLPGAGQFATGHFIKGTLFVGLEGVFGSMVYFWQATGRQRDIEANVFVQRARGDTGLARGVDLEKSYFRRQDGLEARYSSYSFLSWAVGAYVFNALDAVGGSNFWKDSKERNPSTAGWLAAIPGLGLGQLYNGSFSKAGMVMMTQVSLGMMAFGNQRLMARAEDNYARLTSAQPQDTVGQQLAAQYASSWDGARNQAFTNRNLYLWYSLFFYFYAIFDAVVDAHLHDYPEKMKIQPDLAVGNKQVKISVNTTF